jgi:hypothetical protein
VTLPTNIALWPTRQRDDYEERAAIREFDGHQPTEEARAAAEAEVRASVAGQLSLEGIG